MGVVFQPTVAVVFRVLVLEGLRDRLSDGGRDVGHAMGPTHGERRRGHGLEHGATTLSFRLLPADEIMSTRVWSEGGVGRERVVSWSM